METELPEFVEDVTPPGAIYREYRIRPGYENQAIEVVHGWFTNVVCDAKAQDSPELRAARELYLKEIENGKAL